MTEAIRKALAKRPGAARLMEFSARLFLLALPLYIVIWLGVDLYPIQLAAVSHSSWLLSLTGSHVVVEGTSITVNSSFEFFIIPDCTGWKSMLFLFALLFAVPGASIGKRLAGLALGLPLVWAGNLMRILGVVRLQSWLGTESALFYHDTLFQLLMVGLVLGIWLAWLRYPYRGASWRRIASFGGLLPGRQGARR